MNPQSENGAARAENGAGALPPTIVANGHDESGILDEPEPQAQARRQVEIASSDSVAADARSPSAVQSFLERMKDAVKYEELRRRIEETPDRVGDIAAEHGITAQRLSKYQSQQSWTRRHPQAPGALRARDGTPISRKRGANPSPNAARVKWRLIELVDRQIGKVGARLRRKGAVVEEKDARILGTLAKTLQTLMALERGDGATAKEPEPVDIDEYRSELARRIRRWAQGGEEPGRAAEDTGHP